MLREREEGREGEKQERQEGGRRKAEDTRWNDAELYDVASRVMSHYFRHILFTRAVISSAREKIVFTT